MRSSNPNLLSNLMSVNGASADAEFIEGMEDRKKRHVTLLTIHSASSSFFALLLLHGLLEEVL